MRRLCLTLLLIETTLSLAPTPHIDWCLYWRYLNKDQFRPECNGVYRLRFSKLKAHDQRRITTPANQPWTPARPVPVQKFNSYVPIISNGDKFGECRAVNSNCQRSNECASGQLCIDASGYCCGVERIITECPSPSTLVSHCSFRRRSVNWCNNDSECAPHLAPRENVFFFNDVTILDSIQKAPSLCCPTQCGYNVCVR